MKHILSILLVCSSAVIHAQDYRIVQHLNGTEQVGNCAVTVTPYGMHTSNTSFNGLAPYIAGNKKQNNGYDFQFAQPVSKLRLRFTAMNEGERIEIGINGNKYALQPTQVNPYVAEHPGLTAIVDDGVLTIEGKNVTASATIELQPGYDIHSLYVHHLNGLKAGTVFEVSIAANMASSGLSVNNYSNNGSGLQIFPNPNTGDFTVSGNVINNGLIQLQIVNDLGQVVFEKNITPVMQSVNEHISLDKSIANGLYVLYLGKSEKGQKIKFTLDR